ncbi:histidinol-phosphatase [Candidatus Peregrinibacteria bacterium]|jgi:histidinol-phosphate aminotransferase|nr:histidinol-phosphatase [Candidatus Peregrinibacteria bacterium]
MTKYALPQIQELSPYNPPLGGRRETNSLLLNFNERTVPVPVKVTEALTAMLIDNKVQIYPEYGDLCNKIGDYCGVKNSEVMITNGSGQGIDLIFRTFTKKGDKVVIPSPSFALFYQCAKVVGNEIITPEYTFEKGFPFEETLESIRDGVKLIVLCNPNNPTGTLVSLEEIEMIVSTAREAGTVVIVDEAYFEFSKVTAVDLIKKFDNLLVTRTFSKAFGLASLRIGYVVGSEALIDDLLKVRGPYDVNMAAAVAASAALDSLADLNTYVDEVINISKPMLEAELQKRGIRFFKSSSNFLLVEQKFDFNFDFLQKKGILTRWRADGFVRITIGTLEQMQKLINLVFMQKYAILDRDGTLIFEPQDDYQIDSLEKLEVLPGVIDGLQKLQTAGYKLVMVTNQNGVGTESFPKEDYWTPQNRLMEIFKSNGIEFEEVFMCPHLPEDNCKCRKPQIGLMEDFLKTADIDMDNSFVSGDRETDNEFADNLGVKYLEMPLNRDFNRVIDQLEL